jgi:hypothetical protein
MTKEEFYEILNKNRMESQLKISGMLERLSPEERSNNGIVASRLVSFSIVEAQDSLIKALCSAGVIRFDD